jgi:hypothetical protein
MSAFFAVLVIVGAARGTCLTVSSATSIVSTAILAVCSTALAVSAAMWLSLTRLIIRNGFGKKFEIRAVVDKIARHNYADIQTSFSSDKNGFTEVEAHIPYDPKLSKIVNPNALWFVLVKYALLNPHIGFNFSVVNNDGSSRFR